MELASAALIGPGDTQGREEDGEARVTEATRQFEGVNPDAADGIGGHKDPRREVISGHGRAPARVRAAAPRASSWRSLNAE